MSEYTPIVYAEDMTKLLRFNNALVAESNGNPFAAISDVAKAGFNHVTGTLAGLTQSFKTLFTTKVEELELGFSPASTKASLNSVRYVDMVDMLAYRPSGLKCSYRVYLDVLCMCADFIARAEDEFLAPYQNFVTDVLGGKLNNSVTGFNVKTERFTEERLALLASVSELFKEKENDRKPATDDLETTWGKVVSNNAEWDGVCQLVVKLNKTMNNINRAKLKERADRVSKVLNGIMQANSTSYSSKTLNDISSGGVEYVSILEFYSVTYYRTLTMLAAIENTAKHIKATLGK